MPRIPRAIIGGAMLWMLAAFAAPDRLWLDHRLEMPPSSDPDEANLMYTISGYSSAKGGGSVGFAGRPGSWGFGIAGFVELETVFEAGPLPWQAYRANLGLRFVNRLVRGKSTWFVDGGYFHESDHAADVIALAKVFDLPAEDFPNQYLSTQEYLKLRVGWQRGERFRAFVRGGVRVYMPNFVPRDQSRRDLALSVETRPTLDLHPQMELFLSGYAEIVFNRYEGELPTSFRGGAYRYWQMEAGFRTGGFDIFSGVRGGNGRGVGFVIVHRPIWTLFGLRAAL